jgi:hypothetical protein
MKGLKRKVVAWLRGCGVAHRVRRGSVGCGVAQLVAHWAAERRPRVRSKPLREKDRHLLNSEHLLYREESIVYRRTGSIESLLSKYSTGTLAHLLDGVTGSRQYLHVGRVPRLST